MDDEKNKFGRSCAFTKKQPDDIITKLSTLGGPGGDGNTEHNFLANQR
jgi:hypothetical protein